MPMLQCPSCNCALSIGDGLAGARVRCPSCQTIFQAPAVAPKTPPVPSPAAAPLAPPKQATAPQAPWAEPPVTVEPVAAPIPRTAPVQPQGAFDFGGSASTSAPSPGQAFQFEEPQNQGFSRIRTMARTGAASNWLTTGAFLFFFDAIGVVIIVLSGMGNSGPRVHTDDFVAFTVAMLILLGLAALFVLTPMILIVLGARNLRSQKSYALAMTGAIVAIIVSIPTLLGGLLWSVIATLFASAALSRNAPVAMLSLIPLAVAIVLLATGGCCLMGAIQAFRALGHPEVADAFRARREGR